jgi:hypothetical protein
MKQTLWVLLVAGGVYVTHFKVNGIIILFIILFSSEGLSNQSDKHKLMFFYSINGKTNNYESHFNEKRYNLFYNNLTSSTL